MDLKLWSSAASSRDCLLGKQIGGLNCAQPTWDLEHMVHPWVHYQMIGSDHPSGGAYGPRSQFWKNSQRRPETWKFRFLLGFLADFLWFELESTYKNPIHNMKLNNQIDRAWNLDLCIIWGHRQYSELNNNGYAQQEIKLNHHLRSLITSWNWIARILELEMKI